MASTQAQKLPTITEWDARYKVPTELNDLLNTYDTSINFGADKIPKKERRRESAEIDNVQEIESLALKENFNADYHLLNDAIRFEEWIQKALNGVIQNAKDYENNIKQIDDIKSSVIEKINKFYEESSVMLEQQKILVDTGVQVQSILSYFQDCEKLEKDIENLSLNISNIHIYEPNLQRFLSEIIDSIEFFQSKPNYKNSQDFLEKYDKLKRKLLSIIKSMFIKLFTREQNEIIKEMERFPFDKLEITNKEATINLEKNKELMIIVFPELNQHFQDPKTIDPAQGPEGRYLNKNLRNLLSYLNLLTKFDFDSAETLKDIFGSYYGTFRKTLQNKILENTVNQFHRGQSKELQNVLSKMVSLSLQATFFELIYYNYFFNNTIYLNESSLVNAIIKDLLAKYFDYIFAFIQIEHDLNNFFEAIDVLNFYISPLESNQAKGESSTNSSPALPNNQRELDEKNEREKNFREGIFRNVQWELNFIDMFEIQNKLKDEDGTNFEKFIEVYVGFLKRIRSEINSRLLEKIQSYVASRINNFNLNQYWKEFNQRYNSNPNEIKKNDIYKSPFFRVDMRSEIFPLVKVACELLFNLKNRAEKKTFQSLYNQIISVTINNIYLASDLFVEKTDSFLFLLKNFIYLTNRLAEFSIGFNGEEADVEQKPEAGLFEKIVTNVSLFGGKKVSQKMLDYGCDLKMEPAQHLEKISERFIEDIDFIISIKLVEYLNRYRYLESHMPTEKTPTNTSSLDKIPSLTDASSDKELSVTRGSKGTLENRRKVEAEAVKKEMESILSKDMVKKCYLMFTNNIEDILQDLANKMQVYLNPQDYDKVYNLVEFIINDLLGMLSQFYVLVSQNYSEEDYKEFNFVEVDDEKYKKRLCSIFVQENSE